MDVRHLPLDEVAQRCAEETDKFRHKHAADNQFCFELFRRALEEGDHEAFKYIFQVYQSQCARWVRNVRGFEAAGELTPDLFVSQAFANLHKDLRGEKFKRFASLEAVLQYLRKCAVTAVLQHLRKVELAELTLDRSEELHANLAEELKTEVEYEELWERICRLLPDETDRLLADLRLRQNIMPAQIARMHPEHWVDSRAVSVAMQRILRTLRRDRELRAMAGLSPKDEKLLDWL